MKRPFEIRISGVIDEGALWAENGLIERVSRVAGYGEPIDDAVIETHFTDALGRLCELELMRQRACQEAT